jgi:hypothetical protein
VGGLLAALVLAACLLMPTAAQAAEALDQQQTVETFFYTGITLAPAGQSFTAGITGRLTRVSLKLGQRIDNGGNPGILRVEIYDTSGGFPVGSPLARAAVSNTGVPAWPESSWRDVTFARAPLVAVGRQYAIVLSNPSTTGGKRRPPAFYTWSVADGNPYAAGAFLGVSESGSWYDDPDYDGDFKTYVDPTGAATPILAPGR